MLLKMRIRKIWLPKKEEILRDAAKGICTKTGAKVSDEGVI